jgi:uncharacterized protein (DUF1501 family)
MVPGGCLACRLVEHGVRFVEVQYGGFDWHSDAFTKADEMLPILDQAYSALLTDPKQRGLLETTPVVIATELGRTPKIDDYSGRNHFPKAFFFFSLAGAGIKGGTVYGESDKTASNVITEKTSAFDFNSTIASAMGLHHDQVLYSPNKRPIKMGGKTVKPISEILV